MYSDCCMVYITFKVCSSIWHFIGIQIGSSARITFGCVLQKIYMNVCMYTIMHVHLHPPPLVDSTACGHVHMRCQHVQTGHTSHANIKPARCINCVLYAYTCTYLSVVPAEWLKSRRCGPSCITELSRVVFMKKNRLA